jgi:hypothetical protein
MGPNVSRTGDTVQSVNNLPIGANRRIRFIESEDRTAENTDVGIASAHRITTKLTALVNFTKQKC